MLFLRICGADSLDLGPFLYNVCGVMQQWVFQTPFKNVKLKMQLVEVWSRTLSALLSMNEESIFVPVFTETADVSNIYFNSWTTGQLDKLSAKLTEIWTKCALCVLF